MGLPFRSITLDNNVGFVYDLIFGKESLLSVLSDNEMIFPLVLRPIQAAYFISPFLM